MQVEKMSTTASFLLFPTIYTANFPFLILPLRISPLQAIKSQEQRMKGILTMVLNLLPEAYRKTRNKLDAEQFIAVLQGITGFAVAIKGKDPLGFIDSAVGIMDYEINKPCLKSLGTIRKNLKKWLTFGKEYKPLKDSSDLNFDKVKVSAIPEVMKVRLTNICLKTDKILR